MGSIGSLFQASALEVHQFVTPAHVEQGEHTHSYEVAPVVVHVQGVWLVMTGVLHHLFVGELGRLAGFGGLHYWAFDCGNTSFRVVPVKEGPAGPEQQ